MAPQRPRRAAGAPPLPAVNPAANSERERGLGPLTEVSGLRRAAEEFRRVSPDLPTAPGGQKAVPPHREIAAERHRLHGAKLIEGGRPAAAIPALIKATRLDPHNAAAHQALGCALLEVGRVEEAVERLRLAIALREDAGAYLSLAIALRRQRRDEEVAAAYRRAIELDPMLIAAHLGLAGQLEAAGDAAAAANPLRHAAALLPDTAEGLLYLSNALIIEGDLVAAEVRLREAAALDSENDQVVKRLGDVLARQGRFAEAREAFDCALALNPDNASTHFAAAEAWKCTEADRPRLTQVLAALGDPSGDEPDRLQLHFTAGKMYDDLGDYEAAMHHFDAANQIRAQYVSFDAAAFAADVDRLINRFTPEFFVANTAFGEDDETPVLIVGLPRSGTTLVEQILTRHRAIGGGGEQGFWLRRGATRGILEATYLTPEGGRELARQYLALLRQLAPAARVTDKLPFNVLCLGLIHLALPKARIVQCRRHPVDTCLSIYFTHFQHKIAFACSKLALAEAYREYARLMDHWSAVMPADRFMEIDYERLVVEREAVTQEMIAFLGLEWDEACLWPERNRRPIRTASLWQARQPVYSSSVARWRNYRPWLGELRQLLAAEDDGGTEDDQIK